jgi:hypothetical protein
MQMVAQGWPCRCAALMHNEPEIFQAVGLLQIAARVVAQRPANAAATEPAHSDGAVHPIGSYATPSRRSIGSRRSMIVAIASAMMRFASTGSFTGWPSR